MAVVNVKSTAVTNADATPVDLSAPFLSHGRLREAIGTVEVANGDSSTSVYRMARLFSSWRVSEILESHDDIGTTTTGDIGLYETAANGGAAADADLFASAVVFNAGAVTAANVTFESGVSGIEEVEKRIWELLGLTEDPKKWYDLCVTLVGAADGAGTITLQVRYVDGT
jgi:hypothetical protein